MNIKKYKKKDGKTYYEFYIRVKHIVTRRRGFKTKAEAKKKYLELAEELKDKANYTLYKIKYEDLYNRWMKTYETTVKESTLQKTLTNFKLHILPFFKDYKVKDIKPYMCQEFADSLKHKTNGKHLFNEAKRVYQFAVRMDIVNKNPFNNVILPKFKPKVIRDEYLTVKEVHALLDYLKDDLYWYTAFRLLIYTGIRRGELLALEWSDIDFKNGELSINKTLSTGINYQVILTTPKSRKSIRKILVDKETLTSLKTLKIQSTDKIVFARNKGRYKRLSDVADVLHKATEAIGIRKIRVHDLRHTHASLLFASGSTAKEVQERLGHSDIKTTMNIYTHVTPETRIKSMENFVSYLDEEAKM